MYYIAKFSLPGLVALCLAACSTPDPILIPEAVMLAEVPAEQLKKAAKPECDGKRQADYGLPDVERQRDCYRKAEGALRSKHGELVDAVVDRQNEAKKIKEEIDKKAGELKSGKKSPPTS